MSPLFLFSVAKGDAPVAMRFIPLTTPCRVVDTRGPDGTFGGPAMPGDTTRDFPIPSSACGVPATALAYSLNVAVVPAVPLGFLTVYPTGQARPYVSTLNSLDHRIKSNAAIVPAGTLGAISVYATNLTHVILDVSGYFVSASDPSAWTYYPTTPCRVADTRVPPATPLSAGETRTIPVVPSSCIIPNLPGVPQTYSLNVTAVPPGPLGFATAWTYPLARPDTATLNAVTGTTTANAAFVTGNGISSKPINVFASNATDLVIDANGYFMPIPGGLSLYNVPPCRVLDTRLPAGSAPFSGQLEVAVATSGCGVPSTAKAFVMAVAVVPAGPLGFLTLWPQGDVRPTVATLISLDGMVTSNLAIVPTSNGNISAFATNPTHLVLDVFGYFAP